MSVGRKGRHTVAEPAVDDWPEVLWRTPVIIQTGAVGHVNVELPEAARAIRGDVETQPIRRDRRMLIVELRIDDRAEIDRWGPFRKVPKVLLTAALVSMGLILSKP